MLESPCIVLIIILLIVSLTETFFTVSLLVTMTNFLYFINAHISTPSGLIAALITLPTSIKILVYRSKSLETNIDKRAFYRFLLGTGIVLHGISFAVTFISMGYTSRLNTSFVSSMKKYQNNLNSKILVDHIQINLQCCGSTTYNNWFNVDWTGSAIVLNKQNNEKEVTDTTKSDVERSVDDESLDESIRWDTVPFSCCSVNSPEPCVNKDLEQLGTTTIYSNGCSTPLLHVALTIYCTQLTLNAIIIVISVIMFIPCVRALKKNDAYTQLRTKKPDNNAMKNTDHEKQMFMGKKKEEVRRNTTTDSSEYEHYVYKNDSDCNINLSELKECKCYKHSYIKKTEVDKQNISRYNIFNKFNKKIIKNDSTDQSVGDDQKHVWNDPLRMQSDTTTGSDVRTNRKDETVEESKAHRKITFKKKDRVDKQFDEQENSKYIEVVQKESFIDSPDVLKFKSKKKWNYKPIILKTKDKTKNWGTNDQVSKDQVSKDQVSKDKISKDKISKHMASKDISKDKIPKDKIPKDKIPKDKIPKDKIPKNKTPKKKIPKNKTPNDNIPNNKVSNDKFSNDKFSHDKSSNDKTSNDNSNDKVSYKVSKDKVSKNKVSNKTLKHKAPRDKIVTYKVIKDEKIVNKKPPIKTYKFKKPKLKVIVSNEPTSLSDETPKSDETKESNKKKLKKILKI